ARGREAAPEPAIGVAGPERVGRPWVGRAGRAIRRLPHRRRRGRGGFRGPGPQRGERTSGAGGTEVGIASRVALPTRLATWPRIVISWLSGTGRGLRRPPRGSSAPDASGRGAWGGGAPCGRKHG